MESGSLELYDPLSNTQIKQFSGHSGKLADIDVRGSYIATCGYSARRYQSQIDVVADPLVNIYDIRMMKPLAPYPFPAGALRVRFHPKLPNIMVVALLTGQLLFVDIYDQTNVYFYQGDVEEVRTMEISSNGDYLAFAGPSEVHLWSIGTAEGFVSFPAPTEHADPVTEPPPIGFDETVPLNVVGMPYYKDPLLSNWPLNMVFTKETAKLPVRVDGESGTFMPYDRSLHTRHNAYHSLVAPTKAGFPRFLSERRTPQPALDIFLSRHDKHQIQYSKFGVKDFDFASFNSTAYCGLENHVDNLYGNALLQVLRFVPGVYNLVVGSLAKETLEYPKDRTREDAADFSGANTSDNLNSGDPGSLPSLTHDLGYLFDMMHKAKQTNVTATNLARTVSTLAPRLANTDEGATLNARELRGLSIELARFMFAQIEYELGPHASQLLDIVGFEGLRHHEYVLDLMTPPSNVLNKMSILLLLTRTAPTPATARKSTTLVTYLEHAVQAAGITGFRPVVVLSLGVSDEELRLVGSFKRWLVPEFYVQGSNVRATIPPLKYRKLPDGVSRYELVGYVCEISHLADAVRGAHNLVAYVRVDLQWVLFNDFLVTPVDDDEVFDLSWKRPVLLVYSSVGGRFKNFEYGNFNVDLAVLYRDCLEGRVGEKNGKNSDGNQLENNHLENKDNLENPIYLDHFSEGIRRGHAREFELLTRSEAPLPGSLVAMDAEFVTLRPEEVEVHYDGARKVVRPKQLSLARLSVLRGELGPKWGVAFIDDFIVHTGAIHDYTTSFSGIEPGDLDLARLDKRLVNRQTAYRRLWLLLNMGVVFVGHGLYNDFRCINIHVPREQIRDTAELYYKSDFKRQLSLKFLVYMVLGRKVQTGNHDSVEDAHGALALYRRAVELKKTGEFEGVLDHVYVEGQQMRFKVPEDGP